MNRRRGLDAFSLSLLIAVVLAIAAVVGALIVGASPGTTQGSGSSSHKPTFSPQPDDRALLVDGVQFDFPAG